MFDDENKVKQKREGGSEDRKKGRWNKRIYGDRKRNRESQRK